MRTGKITAIVRLLILCLTICQFTSAGAQYADDSAPSAPAQRPKAKRASKAKRTPSSAGHDKSAPSGMGSIATPAYRADEMEIEFATAERSDMGHLNEQHQWLTADESVTDPIPKDRMIISTTSLSGSTTAYNTAPSGATRSATANTTTELGPVMKLAYGISDISYLSATVAYLPGTTVTSTSNGPAGNTQSTVNNDGWREPKVAIGTSFRVRRQTRFTTELGGTIPLGSGHMDASGNTTNSNGLVGGGSLIPRLAFVSKLAGVKFVGNAAYNYLFDRHVDWIVGGVQTSRTTSGGHLLDTSLGIEIPAWLNLGLAGIYQNADSATTSWFTANTTTNVNSTSVQHVGGKIYMGIPINETDILVVPSITYLSVLNDQVDNLPVARSDDWKFLIQAVIHF